ncbi:MAG: peptidoglycan bridge formation glycyltransferase FemA/FemB family protein [Candidatus Saccharibacteria bacterium]|nr:peptidoglycan bridge formation glycyltransferase FemA/FemB family protein [Candidatus Saccharibacteria bacterium]
MIFETITKEEFTTFAKNSPYKSFMQTEEIAKLREKGGWTAYFLGVRKNSELIAATMLVAKPTFLGKSTFFAPGGPLLDLNDTKLTNFFLKNLKHFIKTHNGFLFRITPYFELRSRDIDGEPTKDFYHKKALENLKNNGFKAVSDTTQPKYLFALDLENKPYDDLYKDFRKNTRGHIKKAEKQGVTLREIDKSEFKTLKTLTDGTAARRDYDDRSLTYYKNMYDLFAPKNEVKFVLAEAKIDNKVVPISVSMLMTYGDEVVSLFSGSDKKYMRDYNAQYLVKAEMIKFAAENGFKRFNFYGINGLPDKNSKDYGLYDFKKGFNGHVVELLGTYELAVTPLAHIYNFLRKLK